MNQSTNPFWADFAENSTMSDAVVRSAKVGLAAPSGSWVSQSPGFSRLFPMLDKLLKHAFVTEVALSGNNYCLFSWLLPDCGISSWLSPLPANSINSQICEDHKILLSSFGGIKEYVNPPEDTWILNNEDVLTEEQSKKDALFINAYDSAFATTGKSIPIALIEFYLIAREANGNATICHRLNGNVLLFAPDHNFNYLTVYPGCPDYTFYTLHGGVDFRSWINSVAKQWLRPAGIKHHF